MGQSWDLVCVFTSLQLLVGLVAVLQVGNVAANLVGMLLAIQIAWVFLEMSEEMKKLKGKVSAIASSLDSSTQATQKLTQETKQCRLSKR